MFLVGSALVLAKIFTVSLKWHRVTESVSLFVYPKYMMGHGCCTHRMCKGAMLLIFGVLFLLGTTGVWAEFTLMKYWPVVLIVMGLHKMACAGKACKDKDGECCKK